MQSENAINFFKTERKFSFLSSSESSIDEKRDSKLAKSTNNVTSLPSIVPKYDLERALKIGKKNEKYSPFYK